MIDQSDQPELSFATLLAFGERHKRMVLMAALMGACVLGAVRLVRDRSYTATASFIPQVKNTNASISGLAAEFGLAGAGGMGSQSPQFFADLVTSSTLLRQVVTTRYQDAKVGIRTPTSLVDIYRTKGKTSAERVESAMKELQEHLRTTVSPKTGLISLSVSAPSPDLSVAVAQQVIRQVNAMNLELRRSDAAGDRQFAEERAEELAAELRAAENRLQAFMQSNRDYATSPRLQFEQQRLSREVTLRQGVYSSMVSSYEQARIDAARDNPVIEVVDQPVAPARPDPRGLGKGLVGGFLLGCVVGLCLGGALDVWRWRKHNHVA